MDSRKQNDDRTLASGFKSDMGVIICPVFQMYYFKHKCFTPDIYEFISAYICSGYFGFPRLYIHIIW